MFLNHKILILCPFHIKPIMRSQRRFENNAVWCERSEAALFDTGVRKAAFYVGGLHLPREVFWKRILAKSRSLRRCGCQCERVHRIMRRERPNNALGWWCPSALSCSVFLNCTRQNLEIRRSVWKQTEAYRSAAAAKRMNWKRSSVRSDCEFGDMKGVLVEMCFYQQQITPITALISSVNSQKVIAIFLLQYELKRLSKT